MIRGVYLGGAAYSKARLKALQEAVRLQGYQKVSLKAQKLYYWALKPGCSLEPSQETQLQALLEASPGPATESGPVWVVVPRLGTRSPWSSKATDICHRSGLRNIARVEQAVLWSLQEPVSVEIARHAFASLYDPMTQSLLTSIEAGFDLFRDGQPRPVARIPLLQEGEKALKTANQAYGWALSEQELDYLRDYFLAIQRDPTDAELMMFAQANSEHCRHKIFKATWTIDGQEQAYSLFEMIQNTYAQAPEGILSAYKDNAAVFEGPSVTRWWADPKTHCYQKTIEPIASVIKVETHNHPTAISPYPGAATGIGGEIRDEGATGRGAKPKVGLSGFTVSDLNIPGAGQPWEGDLSKPARIRSALDIMIEAPLGGAAFNNEFGRPNILGYFRSYEQRLSSEQRAGYHKPIMIAGGLGNIRPQSVQKQAIPPGALLIVLGGPALKIGLGGGAASSMASGAVANTLDFASVQRDNPEMQRRAQEVIDACWALGEDNPLISLHDVGAGGLCNAFPELVHDAHRGAVFQLGAIPSDEPGMSPMEIWSNESQERYVLAIAPASLELFADIARRERCPYAVVGQSTAAEHLSIEDSVFHNHPVDLPMDWLFGNTPKMHRVVERHFEIFSPVRTDLNPLEEMAQAILRHPTVADKSFLITIGDRSVTGLVVRDQMVGPWQVPVSDVAVVAQGYFDLSGEAMAMGERSPLALISPAASSRMAVGEAITNIVAARIRALSDLRLSANWMAACGVPGQDAALYEAVSALGQDLCPQLGLAIPVGKDSLSMRTVWEEARGTQEVFSPVSCVISAFAPVETIESVLTPEWQFPGQTRLLLIDLGRAQHRLGGSIYAQVSAQIGNSCPDVDEPALLKNFFEAIQQLHQQSHILAYHDRSDGGLWALLCEMAFASGAGFEVDVSEAGQELSAVLFNEELGAVLQISEEHLGEVWSVLRAYQLETYTVDIGSPIRHGNEFKVMYQGKMALNLSREACRRVWSAVSYEIQKRRDDPTCAEEAYENLLRPRSNLEGITLPFQVDQMPFVNRGRQPRVAILREQGVNGHVEMAAAFALAGFEAVDVHMSDFSNPDLLSTFHGLVACGGFSFGDVLGAGGGWAKSILYQPDLREQFEAFFHRSETFSLGVCNGCQMLAQLKNCIPGAEHWPIFVQNRSERFESRLVLVGIEASPSIAFQGMAGAVLPIVVAHGEGQTQFQGEAAQRAEAESFVALRYVTAQGEPAVYYPENPNGSLGGATGYTSVDGRATILMPHPERVIQTSRLSWHPKGWGRFSPWFKMFQNFRTFMG